MSDDLDGLKGLYHLKLVDEITKFQFVALVERLDAACLAPVLDALLRAFPFVIRGFHTDARPEHGNREVTALLRAVGEARRIVGFDVTELSPELGPPASAYVAAKLVYKLIAYATLCYNINRRPAAPGA